MANSRYSASVDPVTGNGAFRGCSDASECASPGVGDQPGLPGLALSSWTSEIERVRPQ